MRDGMLEYILNNGSTGGDYLNKIILNFIVENYFIFLRLIL